MSKSLLSIRYGMYRWPWNQCGRHYWPPSTESRPGTRSVRWSNCSSGRARHGTKRVFHQMPVPNHLLGINDVPDVTTCRATRLWQNKSLPVDRLKPMNLWVATTISTIVHYLTKNCWICILSLPECVCSQPIEVGTRRTSFRQNDRLGKARRNPWKPFNQTKQI